MWESLLMVGCASTDTTPLDQTPEQPCIITTAAFLAVAIGSLNMNPVNACPSELVKLTLVIVTVLLTPLRFSMALTSVAAAASSSSEAPPPQAVSAMAARA